MSNGLYRLFTIGFMAWGCGFGLLAASEFFRVAALDSIGVGASAAVMMTLLMWIGGCVFAGAGALIFKPGVTSAATPDAVVQTPGADWSSDPTTPRLGNHSFASVSSRGEHAGHSYNVHGDGHVVSIVAGKPMTWRSEAGFKTWAESNPA